MKTRPTLLARISNGFKAWMASLHEPQDNPHHQSYNFQDPYKTMDDLHDHEMERLVKAIEHTRNENRSYYN